MGANSEIDPSLESQTITEARHLHWSWTGLHCPGNHVTQVTQDGGGGEGTGVHAVWI